MTLNSLSLSLSLSRVTAFANAQTPPTYRVIDLGELGFIPDIDNKSTSTPDGRFGINSSGQVAYFLKVDTNGHGPPDEFRAYVWLPAPAGSVSAGVHELVPGPQGFPSMAQDINDSGLVIGQVGGVGNGFGLGAVWDLNALASNPVIIPALATSVWSRGIAITDSNPPLVIGQSSRLDDCDTCTQFNDDDEVVIGFVGQLGQVPTVLDLDDCHPSSLPRDVSLTGQIVGHVDATGVPPATFCQEQGACDDGSPRSWDVGGLGVTLDSVNHSLGTDARGINDADNIVGYEVYQVQGGCPIRALFWEAESDPPVTLPITGDSQNRGRAEAINDRQIAGQDRPQAVGQADQAQAAHLWEFDGSVWIDSDLNDLVGCIGSLVYLQMVLDINDSGWIVAYGLEDSDEHAYVLRPTASITCEADLNGDTRVDIKDLVLVINNWSYGDPCASVSQCTADTNYDCLVDDDDLDRVTADWGLCPGSGAPAPPSLAAVIQGAGLQYPDDWVEYLDVVNNSTDEDEIANYNCWMDHYLTRCNPCFGYNCPDSDPFGGH